MFLLLVLFRNPLVFFRAILLDFNLGHPDWSYGQFITKRQELIQESIRYSLSIERTRGRNPVSAWYALAHYVARVLLYQAGRDHALQGNVGRHAWRKVFGPVTPGDVQLHELAAVVNKVTGRMNLATLGISEAQESLESSLIFPRYLRCTLGLVTDAIQGRVRGNESRRLFAHIIVVAIVVVALL